MNAPGSDEHRRHFAAFASAAYGNDTLIPAGYVRDTALSNRNRAVYVNHETKHAVLANRGTVPKGATAAADLSTDAALAVGITGLQPRFKNALRAAKQMQAKYADYSHTATGHSLGGSLAMFVNKKLGMDTVTFSAHTPMGDIQKEAALNLIGGGVRKRKITNYTTTLDPVALGTNLTGTATIVKQTAKSPHALANFLV